MAQLKQFSDFDFEGNEGWNAYLKKVEIPSNSPADLLKVKAKWYRKAIDPDFDVSIVTPLPTSTPSARPQSGQQQQQQPQGRQQPTSGGAASRGGGGLAAVPPELALFLLQSGIIVLSVLYLIPLLPQRLSQRAYTVALLLCFASSMLQLVKQHGPPSFQGFQQWAVRALPSQHFNYAITALMFLNAAPVTVVLAPYVILATYGALGYCATHYSGHPLWRSHGARAYNYMLPRRQAALGLNAQLEISLGFNMLVMLFMPASRNFLVTFFVWQQLRQRYWAPDSGAYHRSVWAGLDAATRSIRQSLPILEKPVGFVQQWFQSANPMAQQARQQQ